MSEYKAPGVYIEEISVGPMPIAGVSTSTAGFVGVTEMGPSEGPPVLVTSFAGFQRKFGGYLDESFEENRFLPYAVESFFTNGGGQCYIMRVLPTEAEPASNKKVSTSVLLQLTEDLKKNDSVISLNSLNGIDSTSKLKLEKLLPDGKAEVTDDVTVEKYNSLNQTVTAHDTLKHAYPKASTRVTVTKLADGKASAGGTLSITATSKGAWGNKIKARFVPTSPARTHIVKEVGAKTARYQLSNKRGFYRGAIVEFNDETAEKKKQYRRVIALQDDIITLSKALTGDHVVYTDATPTTIATCEFSLTVFYKDVVEPFPNLSMNPEAPNYFVKKVNGLSNLVILESPYDGKPFNQTDPFDMPSGDALDTGTLYTLLTEGTDGDPTKLTPDDFKGKDDPAGRSGIQAFLDIDDVNVMAVPGKTDRDVQEALVSHCENTNLKDRFALLEGPQGADREAIKSHRQQLDDTSYAALYHPWIQVFDPLDKKNIFIPPSGAVAGIYARSDRERGVHKAPANEPVQSATGLQNLFNTGEQEDLNPKGVNLIRSFSNRGIRLWGARTLSSELIYVNVRRLLLYIEKSIEQGTQWVVFEPNNEKLWARVIQTITQFLTRVWKDGALMGTSADKAFYVRCDRTTMTQDDIDNGRLIVLIGVAPVKPAEFVVFRIAQWDGGSGITE